jgi:CBS domain-containing protein
MFATTTYLLDAIRIADVMHPGIIDCDSHTPIEDVAERMSRLGVHSLAIRDEDGDAPVIVSDLDVVSAIGSGERGLEIRDVAAGGTVTVSARRSMREAARLMSEHGVTHLVVLDDASGSPCGVISSTDVLAAYASVTAA